MEQPHLFKLNSQLIYCLRNTSYSLKQASKVWYQTIINYLIELNFEQLEIGHGVFSSKDRQRFSTLYSDDFLSFASDKA